MYCLVFRGGRRCKAEGCQSTGAMHSWCSGTPGNKFDIASVVKKPVSQTNKVHQIDNIDAVFGGTSRS